MNNTNRIELEYPRILGHVKFIEIDLMDVRSADGIRISYDFDRDGWKIEQASRFSWVSGEDTNPDWQEVTFVQAWGRKESKEVEAARHAAALI